MTFLEDCGIIIQAQRSKTNIGIALQTVLQEAREDDRLVCGIYACSQILQKIPEDVALCLLLEVTDTEDVAVHIQHKLVETFCWENDIDVVKVDSFKTDRSTLTSEKTDGKMDVDCVLVQNTKSDSDYCTMIVATQSPIKELPVLVKIIKR